MQQFPFIDSVLRVQVQSDPNARRFDRDFSAIDLYLRLTVSIVERQQFIISIQLFELSIHDCFLIQITNEELKFYRNSKK